MASTLVGTWKQDREDNLEKYLEEIGVNWVKRKIITKLYPTMAIEQNGESWVITTTTSVSTQKMEFKIGEDFETDLPGLVEGKFTCTPSLEGDKLTQVVVPTTATIKGMTTTREIEGEELKMTMECGDVTCIRHFKREK